MAKISVLGAGSWGTALSCLLAANQHEVMIWSIDPHEVKMLNTKHEQEEKLPGVLLPDTVSVTGDLAEAAADRDMLVMAVPSPFTRSTARSLAPFVRYGQLIVNVSKGIEEDTLKPLADQIREEIPNSTVAVLSGPSHAEEVGKKLPTAVVVGAERKETAEYVQSLFMNTRFRVYTSPDMLGIQLGGSIKNVIALAAGMADGLGCGDNTKAALITRGSKEITALGIKMGARAETLQGLAGIGDLIVTCASRHSRNRKAGFLIGQGNTMKEAMDEVKMIVEGVYSAKAAEALAKKYDVNMPIIHKVNQVLFEDLPAIQALEELMMRDRGIENASIPWD